MTQSKFLPVLPMKDLWGAVDELTEALIEFEDDKANGKKPSQHLRTLLGNFSSLIKDYRASETKKADYKFATRHAAELEKLYRSYVKPMDLFTQAEKLLGKGPKGRKVTEVKIQTEQKARLVFELFERDAALCYFTHDEIETRLARLGPIPTRKEIADLGGPSEAANHRIGKLVGISPDFLGKLRRQKATSNPCDSHRPVRKVIETLERGFAFDGEDFVAALKKTGRFSEKELGAYLACRSCRKKLRLVSNRGK